jgi:hypothetical protein
VPLRLCREQKYETVGQWCHVSRDLFLRGDLGTFKSGKQCRERWFNYVAPGINKNWTDEEDLALMRGIREQGRHWAKIMPMLNGTKSEHMIKNRYNSILKKKTNELPKEHREDRIMEAIIAELTQKVERQRREIEKLEKERKEREGRELRVRRNGSLLS